MDREKLTWCLLTYNRADTVIRAISQNIKTCGGISYIDDMVWHDNGSETLERSRIQTFLEGVFSLHLTSILSPKNLGVDKGYNSTFGNSRAPWLLVTGCDRLMPEGWLAKMVDVVKHDPNTHCVSIYSQHVSKLTERLYGETYILNGHAVVEAMPFGARLFSRELLHEVGYLREDFGLYGPSDIEWASRCKKVCATKGWKTLVLVDEIAEHLGDEGINEHGGMDPKEYHAFKQQEARDPAKLERLEWCLTENYPYYNPFSGDI